MSGTLGEKLFLSWIIVFTFFSACTSKNEAQTEKQQKELPRMAVGEIQPPQGVSAKTASSGDVVLNWQPVPQQEGKLAVQGHPAQGGEWKTLVQLDTNATSWTHDFRSIVKASNTTQPDAIQKFVYRVCAIEANGETKCAESEVTPIIQDTRPIPSENIRFEKKKDGVMITWDETNAALILFTVDSKSVGTVMGRDSKSFRVSGLGDGSYEVCTLYWSWAGSIKKCSSLVISGPTLVAPPPAPKDARVELLSDNRMQLHWSTSAGAMGYVIERKQAGKETFEQVTSSYIKETSFLLDIKEGAFVYRIRAFTQIDGKGLYSEYSNGASVLIQPGGSVTVNSGAPLLVSIDADYSYDPDYPYNPPSVKMIIESRILGQPDGMELFVEGHDRPTPMEQQAQPEFTRDGASDEWVIEGLSPNADYRAQLCSFSNAVRATLGQNHRDCTKLFAISTRPGREPKPPIIAKCTATSYQSIELIWNAAGNDEDGYTIYRDNHPYGFSQLNWYGIPRLPTIYVDSGLEETKKYCYKITASNQKGTSGYSNICCVKTLKRPIGCPDAVSNIYGYGNLDRAVLDFYFSHQDLSEIRIHASDENGKVGTLLKTLPPSGDGHFNFEHLNLKPSTNYYYVIRSYNPVCKEDESFSGLISIRTQDPNPDPPKPPIVRSESTETEITLRIKPADGPPVSHFEIYRIAGGQPQFLVQYPYYGSETLHMDINLKWDTFYDYIVKAYNIGGSSETKVTVKTKSLTDKGKYVVFLHKFIYGHEDVTTAFLKKQMALLAKMGWERRAETYVALENDFDFSDLENAIGYKRVLEHFQKHGIGFDPGYTSYWANLYRAGAQQFLAAFYTWEGFTQTLADNSSTAYYIHIFGVLGLPKPDDKMLYALSKAKSRELSLLELLKSEQYYLGYVEQQPLRIHLGCDPTPAFRRWYVNGFFVYEGEAQPSTQLRDGQMLAAIWDERTKHTLPLRFPPQEPEFENETQLCRDVSLASAQSGESESP